MTKVKFFAILLITLALILILPNIANAATEFTYSDTEQGIEWSYELNDSDNIVNLKCKTTSVIGEVTIPSTIDGKTVISLYGGSYSWNGGAFQNCAGITKVTIPDTVTVIGGYAFSYCTGLKEITIPNSVTKIDTNAFLDCSGLTSVTFSENLTSIGESAFKNCSGLKNIIIPNSVTTMGEGVFKDCTGLKEITLSESLSKISEESFSNCSGLKSIILSNSVTTIEGLNVYNGAFYACKNLEKILIPDNVATIENYAFQGCSKLTIYGNDEMTSKEYAESNGINFKYISEWNEIDVGEDITPPTLESLKIENGSGLKYESGTGYYLVSPGTTISIKGTFSEVIYGETAPTLTIKCGNGEEINISNGVITGSYIIYTYTIEQKDVGIITAVKLSGGDIKDEAGNAATELICPTLTDSIWDNLVYANGNGVITDNGNAGNEGNNSNEGVENEVSGNQIENGTSNDGNQSENGVANNEKEEDKTVAQEKIPAAGLKIGTISILVAIIVGAIILYSKNRKLRDI